MKPYEAKDKHGWVCVGVCVWASVCGRLFVWASVCVGVCLCGRLLVIVYRELCVGVHNKNMPNYKSLG